MNTDRAQKESRWEPDWARLSAEEKKKELYLKQKRLLQTFLERHAITQEQYEKSLNGLTEKMKMEDVENT